MLSARAKEVKPSPTLAMDAKAKAMAAEGKDVVNFGVGEPDFDTPAHIKDAAKRALDEGFTKYTPAAGILPLKDSVIEKFKADNGLSYARDEVMVSCGAKHCLYNAAQALYDCGDEVLIPSPYWVSYPDQVLLNGAKPVIIPTVEDDYFLIDPAAIEERITPRTKAIIINSPSNPSGCVYGKKTLEKVAEVCLRHNLYIISDEIYEKLIYEGEGHTSIASISDEVKKRTIVVNGLSKSHAMTGWRIGFAAGPKQAIAAMSDIQSQSTSNPNSMAQKAAVAALKGPQDFTAMMRIEFDRRRRMLVAGLNTIPGLSCKMPPGAFFAFPNVSALYGKSAGDRKIGSSSDLALYLLEKAQVALVPGSAFGDDKFIRLSYATSEATLKKGIERIGEAVAVLK